MTFVLAMILAGGLMALMSAARPEPAPLRIPNSTKTGGGA